MATTDLFQQLYSLDVNDRVEKKDGLTYLSWSYAWAEFKKVYPDAVYEVKLDQNTYMPYFASELGIIVYTTVKAGGITHSMWLPVMDGKNKAMKLTPYTYQTKFGEKNVEAATMFDVNKTLMRCLVKNLAMFGLGLYIYEGEDMPEMSNDAVDEIADQVNQYDNVDDLTKFYKANEKIFSTNKKLMELLKVKGAELRAKR